MIEPAPARRTTSPAICFAVRFFQSNPGAPHWQGPQAKPLCRPEVSWRAHSAGRSGQVWPDTGDVCNYGLRTFQLLARFTSAAIKINRMGIRVVPDLVPIG